MMKYIIMYINLIKGYSIIKKYNNCNKSKDVWRIRNRTNKKRNKHSFKYGKIIWNFWNKFLKLRRNEEFLR